MWLNIVKLGCMYIYTGVITKHGGIDMAYQSIVKSRSCGDKTTQP